MKFNDVLEKDKSLLTKCFLGPDQEVYPLKQFEWYEIKAQNICEENHWDWKQTSKTAVKYLLHEKGFIEIGNIDEFCDPYSYLSISEKFREQEVKVKIIAKMLDVKVFWEKS